MNALLPEVIQPNLFDEWPEQPELVERVKEYVHSGRTAARNEDRAERIVGAFLLGVPKRRIARTFAVGRQTIDGLAEVLEAAGKLLPLKERLAAGWAEVALLTIDNLKEALLRREVPANCLAMVGGVATDKLQLLTGSETEIVGIKRARVSMQDILDVVATVRRCDSQSVASLEFTDVSRSISNQDTPADTADTAPQPQAAEGGGGVGHSGVRPQARWDKSQKIYEAKEGS